jgi:hypothetical protein
MAIGTPYRYGLRSVVVSTAMLASFAATPTTPRKDQGPEELPDSLPETPQGQSQTQTAPLSDEAVSKLKMLESPSEEKPLAERFGELVREWKATRDTTGTTSRMIRNPAYQSILRLGPNAITLVLEEMRKEPDEWFYALAYLSGENPIPDACRGRFGPMRDAWLKWGRENGYIAR